MGEKGEEVGVRGGKWGMPTPCPPLYFLDKLNLLYYFNTAHRQCRNLHGIASSKTSGSFAAHAQPVFSIV